ncbi:PP2C family protein-serine/threonine phosphatase [uncultured Paludibaculum sp.]|uniref:PP2C family protein-serine/threonine phosphatase n=1 Tax=uncultured Paludibaculum sp. TaxID=1765020 RepID=UPI002AAADD9F|nr:PP2C family protein-serine/threonine phosphatase [uncultured Paludibaculum sp.]
MKPSSIAIPVLGVAGVAVLATLFGAHDSSTRIWQAQLTRAQAVGAAQKLAAAYGTNISGWQTYVTARVNRQQASVRTFFGQKAITQPFNPLEIRVLATSTRDSEAVMVTLAPDGRPMGYLNRHPRAQTGQVSDANVEGLADRELRRYAGADAAHFECTANGLKSQEGWRSAFEWSDAESPGMVARLEVVTSGTRVVRVNYRLDVAARLMAASREANSTMQGIKVAVVIVLVAALTLLATYLVFAQLTRRKDHTDFGRRCVLISAIPMVLAVASGVARSDGAFRSFDGGGLGDATLVTRLAIDAFLALTIFVLVAAGYSILPTTERPRWVGLRLLSLGRLGDRFLGREVAMGLCAGAGLACLPYLIAALPGWGRIPVEIFDPDFLYSPAPSFEAFKGLILSWETYAFFVLTLPWALYKIVRPGLRWGLLGVCGVLFAAAYREPFPVMPWPNIVYGATLLVGFGLLYRATGMLAVWVAPVGMWAATYAATFLALGQAAGWRVIAVQAVVLVAAVCVWAFGQSTDEEAVQALMEPGELGLSRSDRDRLQAEFTVARRAQQGMLPAAAPEIPGFTIQGSCEPAREVGGDLFDYLPFPNGQWGFCVADVSGKGVPAALYMTMTKGMLASAQTRHPDLPVIASRLNRFVSETGKRRTFITMSLGLLDAERRVFQHVRAGHNPPVLYRASSKKCEFLQPNGLGLGITSGSVFERNLEVQDVELQPGDVIVLYSDGLTECMNSVQEQFGEERLVDVVQRTAHLNARGVEAAIMEAARDFRGEADPHDDLTVVVLRAENGPAARRNET